LVAGLAWPRLLANAVAEGRYNIDSECRGLISEKARYEYKDKTSGDEVTFLDKVKPNQDDHALDTEKYLVKQLSSWKASAAPLFVPYRIEA